MKGEANEGEGAKGRWWRGRRGGLEATGGMGRRAGCQAQEKGGPPTPGARGTSVAAGLSRRVGAGGSGRRRKRRGVWGAKAGVEPRRRGGSARRRKDEKARCRETRRGQARRRMGAFAGRPERSITRHRQTTAASPLSHVDEKERRDDPRKRQAEARDGMTKKRTGCRGGRDIAARQR